MKTSEQAIAERYLWQPRSCHNLPLRKMPPDRQAKFKHYRAQLTAARVSLENAVLQQIANQLSTYESDFKAGCDNLQTEIAALNNTSAILKSLANVTNVLSRIVRVLA